MANHVPALAVSISVENGRVGVSVRQRSVKRKAEELNEASARVAAEALEVEAMAEKALAKAEAVAKEMKMDVVVEVAAEPTSEDLETSALDELLALQNVQRAAEAATAILSNDGSPHDKKNTASPPTVICSKVDFTSPKDVATEVVDSPRSTPHSVFATLDALLKTPLMHAAASPSFELKAVSEDLVAATAISPSPSPEALFEARLSEAAAEAVGAFVTIQTIASVAGSIKERLRSSKEVRKTEAQQQLEQQQQQPPPPPSEQQQQQPDTVDPERTKQPEHAVADDEHPPLPTARAAHPPHRPRAPSHDSSSSWASLTSERPTPQADPRLQKLVERMLAQRSKCFVPVYSSRISYEREQRGFAGFERRVSDSSFDRSDDGWGSARAVRVTAVCYRPVEPFEPGHGRLVERYCQQRQLRSQRFREAYYRKRLIGWLV